MKNRLIPLVALPLAGLALLAAACGDGADEDTPAAATTVAPVRTATRAAETSPTPVPGKPVTAPDNATTTATGLKYVDNKVGDGASPAATATVTVNYTGRLASNGQVFDTTDGKAPISFAMNGVIKGFSEGLSTMKVGGKRTVYIPAALGYGARAQGPIPANSDLVFDIELVAIK